MDAQEIRTQLDTLKATPAKLKAALKGVPKKTLLFVPAPGKWSILEIVCHLRDMERDAYLARYQRILAEPEPPLPDVDGDLYSIERDYRNASLSEALRDWTRLRKECLKLLSRVKGEQWQRAGVHESAGRLTMADLLRRHAVGNDEAHLGQVDAIKARHALLGRLESMPSRLAAALRGASDEALRKAAGPGKWSAIEVACHLRDLDRLYAERFSRMAFSEKPQLWMLDQKRTAEQLRYREQATTAVVKEVTRRRGDVVTLLRALPHAVWQRTGHHPTRGEITIEKLAQVVADHDDAHLRQIAAALAG
ncbi:MAG: DinB family protein [Vicinamibacteria bacterium]